jgi:hypothetical protein
VVGLAARGDEVEALVLAVEDDGGSELPVRAEATVELVGDGAGKGDRVALDDDVDVEVPLAEQDVADGAADEVHALVWLVDRDNRVESRRDALRELEGGHFEVILPCGLAHFWLTSVQDTRAFPRYDRIGEEVSGYQQPTDPNGHGP